MRYDLLSLEIFLAVAELGGVTRASQRCHLAASAVSKRITELEEKVGAPLFIRNARGMQLTPAGRSLRHYAQQLLDMLKRMELELGEYGAGIKGHIRLHAITSALAQQLTLDIAGFLETYPQVRFDIEERSGAAVVRAVSDGRADLGIVGEHTPALGLETALYRADEMVIAVAENHPLASRKSIAFAEALTYEFIAPHPESSVHRLLTEQARLLGGEIKQRIRVSSFDSLCRMVSTNLGIGFIPRGVLRPYLRQFRLRALTLDERWADRSLFMVARSFEALDPTTRAFADHLCADRS
ncbi:LysR family transcriptional regulator [Stutzerimonas chloritidismutans]|uniref:LysR family transcriptional regulator n=1 Tax=Stutzerimonas chloritidismutans TaxID=203192 RepID=UPI003F17F711